MTDDTFIDIDENTASINHLRMIPALEQFSEKDLKELLKVSRIKTYTDNELIIAENEKDDTVYYLISGKVKVIKGGKELMILRRTGDVFGEIGVVTGVARTASIYSIGRTTCLEIKVSALDYLSEANRLMFKYLLFRSFAEIMANRLKKTTEELAAAKQKIAELEEKNKP